MQNPLPEIFSSLVHLFFPHLCRGCGTDTVPRNSLLCLHCLSALPYTGFSLHADNPVEKVFWGRLRAEAAMSLLYFSPASIVQRIIHQIKYRGQKELAIEMGRMMGREILQSQRFCDLDCIIPLPLFRQREIQRGYNQSALLARGISDITGIQVDEKCMKRTRPAETQTHKSREKRWQNVSGLFALQPGSIPPGCRVLLVDDVITTGATIEACGRLINEVPDTSLHIASLAYALQ